MLRKLTLALSLLFCSAGSFATHLEGGQLRYEFNGTNYTVYATLYAVCGTSGITQQPSVNFYSPSCSDSFTRVLPLTAIDTLQDFWCPGTTVTCGGGFTSIVAVTFSDTVSLDACSDWKLSTVYTALNSTIDNLGQNPQMYDLYLEATLDNSTAINRNASVINDPPFFVGTNTINTFAFQSVDADGDSVVLALEQLLVAPGTTLPFGTGFSVSNQLGTYTGFDSNTQRLSVHATVQSEDMMVTRIKEYRNGAQVGSYTRTWLTRVRPLTAQSNPMIVPGTQITYTTCPGQSNTITLNFEDSVSTDSIFIDFYPPSLSGFTFSTTSTNTAGPATGTISWTTPTTVNVNTLPYFIIPVRARDNKCPNQGYSYYSIVVNLLQCNPDSVWAGDANADFTADMYDPLAIAVAYGTTGIVRPGATTSWQAEYCPNWTTQFTNGINHKHADCNGDGTVNNTDLAAITANYGQVHLKPGGAHEKSAALPDLYFDFTGLQFIPGGTVVVPLKLGNTTTMMNNIYGVATNIDLQGVTFSAAPAFNTTASWIGNTSSLLNFTHGASNNNVDFVQSRNDQQNVSGQGTITTMTLTIPNAVPDGTPLIFHLGQSRIIDNNGNDVTGFNIVDDTAYINATNVNATINYTPDAVIVPNPSRNGAHLQLTSATDEQATMVVTNVTGRMIYRKNVKITKGTQNISLPVVAPGMYEVQVQTTGMPAKAMKWIQL